jgi:hypothetical protein
MSNLADELHSSRTNTCECCKRESLEGATLAVLDSHYTQRASVSRHVATWQGVQAALQTYEEARG